MEAIVYSGFCQGNFRIAFSVKAFLGAIADTNFKWHGRYSVLKNQYLATRRISLGPLSNDRIEYF